MMSILDLKHCFERALFVLFLPEDPLKIFSLSFCIFLSFTKEKKKDCIARKRSTPSPPMKKNGRHKASCCQQEWKCLVTGRGRNLAGFLSRILSSTGSCRILPGPCSDYSKTGRGKDTLTQHLRSRAREQSLANQRNQ